MVNIDLKDLQKLYIAYFNRPGDPNGINYWLSRYDQSFTLMEISKELDSGIQTSSADKLFDVFSEYSDGFKGISI